MLLLSELHIAYLIVEAEMKGLRLSSLTGELKKVTKKYLEKPASSIRDPIERLSSVSKARAFARNPEFSFADDYHRLSLDDLSVFSFNELCKLKYSTIFMLHETVDKLFHRSARHEFFHKVTSSMWRWGYNMGTWNEVVDAYNRIRNFTFTNDPNFEVRLDYTTGNNEFGYSKYSRTYIDGVFAFLVYYKKKHVLTIRFSVMGGKQILIQQVQSAERTGNRYLYQLPRNRMEFVIGLFRKNFRGYKLHVIDARSLVKKTLSDYRNGLLRTKERCKRLRTELETSPVMQADLTRWLKKSEEERGELKERIAHLKIDRERLDSFYRNTGRFTLGPAKRIMNNLVHYCVSI